MKKLTTLFVALLMIISVSGFSQTQKTEAQLLTYITDSLVVGNKIQSSKFLQFLKDINASKEDSTWIANYVTGIGYVITTANTTELNILDGALVSTAELNRSVGVTSNIQNQLDLKGDSVWADSTFIKVADAETATVYTTAEVDSIIASFTDYTPYAVRVVEPKSRVILQSVAYTGTIRNVPSPYSTITDAYSAANDGDIIQLADGTYQLSAESGGYLYLNTGAKGVLIRGNPSNNGAVTINHSTDSQYAVRLGASTDITFQNITFTSSNITIYGFIYQSTSSDWVKAINCVFTCTNTATNSRIFSRYSSDANTNPVYVEFDRCIFNHSGGEAGTYPIYYIQSGVNEKLIVHNSTFNISQSSGVKWQSSNKGNLYFYNNTINMSVNQTAVQVGEDSTTPTYTSAFADIRSNTITFTEGFYGHGVLLGRGSDSVMCINNTVTVPSVSSSLALGIVVKTTSGSIGNSYIAGNYIVAPRPFYIKGGKNIIANYNTFVANYTGTGALEVDNPSDVLLSQTNRLKYNNFIGTSYSIYTTTNASWEKPEVSMQDWTMDYNRYYFDTNWAYSENGTVSHDFVSKYTFWLNNWNDYNSIVMSSSTVNYNPTPIIDNTTINLP